MIEKVIPIVVSKEDFVREYLKMTTFSRLTSLELDILAEICGYEKVGRREKSKIRNRLALTVYSMNNVVSSLKKKGFIEHNEAAHTYRAPIDIPKDLDRLVFTIEQV